MALPLYLAMTGAEMHQATTLPEKPAWMACHFSPYSTGLSNFPPELPRGSMIIVNDRTPVCGHDPQRIAAQLQQLTAEFCADGVLLDFQRPDDAQTAQIAKTVTETLDCPVGVSAHYAKALCCPVFLDPVPLHKPLAEHIQEWTGRELWLDVAPDSEEITVDADGSRYSPAFLCDPLDGGFEEPKLHCRYRIRMQQHCAQFTLWRTDTCIRSLLLEAETLGVSRAFGLYQQLGNKKPAD